MKFLPAVIKPRNDFILATAGRPKIKEASCNLDQDCGKENLTMTIVKLNAGLDFSY